MKKLILSFFAVIIFQQAFSFAIVCYTAYGTTSCFWTNYNCSDFTNCTQNCTCQDLAIATSSDPNNGVFEFTTEGTMLKIRKQGTTSWTNLVNLSTIMNVNTQVFKVTMNCALNRVSISTYTASCLNSGNDVGSCFVRTRNISYVCP